MIRRGKRRTRFRQNYATNYNPLRGSRSIDPFYGTRYVMHRRTASTMSASLTYGTWFIFSISAFVRVTVHRISTLPENYPTSDWHRYLMSRGNYSCFCRDVRLSVAFVLGERTEYSAEDRSCASLYLFQIFLRSGSVAFIVTRMFPNFTTEWIDQSQPTNLELYKWLKSSKTLKFERTKFIRVASISLIGTNLENNKKWVMRRTNDI